MANLIVINKMSAEATIYDVVAPAGLTNGNLVVLGTQNATTKYYACAAPAAITDKGMALVLAVPLSYEAEKVENDYAIATGEVVRAYQPYVGMVVSVPSANITAGVPIAVGAYVIPAAGALKMTSAAALGGTEAVAFIIDEVYTKSGVAMAKIRCIVA
jgi:ABC-type amino acid transport system permease subunit